MAFKNFLIPESYSIVRDVTYDHHLGVVNCTIAVFADQASSNNQENIPPLISKQYLIAKNESEVEYTNATTESDSYSTPSAGDRILINNPDSEFHGQILWVRSGTVMHESVATGSKILVQDTGKLYLATDSDLVEQVAADNEVDLWSSYFSIDSLSADGVSLISQIYKFLKENRVEFAGTEDC